MKRGEQAKLIRELESEHGLRPSKTIISRMIKEKDYRIKLTPKGNIDIEPTVKALLDSDFPDRVKKITETISAKKDKPAPKSKTEKEETKSTVEPGKDIQDYLVDGRLSLTAPRSIADRYKSIQSAEKDRIKNEKELKTLVDFNKTADTVFNFIRPLRDDLLEVAKRVSPMAYMAGSKQDAEKIINDEINRIILSRVGDDYRLDDELKKKIIKILRVQLA